MSMHFSKDVIHHNACQLIDQARTLPPLQNEESLYDHLHVSSTEKIHFNPRYSDASQIALVKSHLNATHQLFHRFLDSLENDSLPRYRVYLRTLCEGEECEEGKIAEHRDAISQGFKAIGPLLSECKWGNLERLQRIFERHFCAGCFRLFDEMQRVHDIVVLQGLLNRQLPVKNLLGVALNGHDENDLLEKFLAQLYQKRVPPAILHRALKAIVETIHEGPDLESLEMFLQDQWEDLVEQGEVSNQEWALFETPDLSFIAQHRLLQPGQVFRTAEGHRFLHEFILGDPVMLKEDKCAFRIRSYSISVLSNSLHDHFERARNPLAQPDVEKMVLWFGPNPAMPGINKCRAMRQPAEQGPDLCPTLVDSRGRFCLVSIPNAI